MSRFWTDWFFSSRRRNVQAPRVAVAPMECRALLSSVSAAAKAAPKDDAFEQNDLRSTATDLGTLADSVKSWSGKLYDDDWFKFRTLSAGTASDSIKLKFKHSRGDINIRLTTQFGSLLRSSVGVTDTETISLEGLAAGNYAIQVFGAEGATNPSYTLTIDTPAHSPLPADDSREQNDTRQTASVITGNSNQVLTNLVNNDDDWFTFTTTQRGTASNLVQIGFDHAIGNLTLGLYNSRGKHIKESNSQANFESIALTDLPAGQYYVKVSKTGDQFNASYDLSLNLPNGIDGKHTLYLNFDGASMTRSQLDAWSRNEWASPWAGDLYSDIDPEGNGVTVSPLYRSAADRESTIAQIIQMVQADLAPFGIQVVRHFGLAVDNILATTVFVGSSSHGQHIAGSLDAGNDNRTDIAFVDEEVWDTRSDNILAMADVILHEAGHTFGLYHVVSGNASETMGLRYNTPSTSWVRDTAFLDITYQRLAGHGPAGTQNSYQYMLSTFGSVPVTNSPSLTLVGRKDNMWSELFTSI
jgi:hypothetical protein